MNGIVQKCGDSGSGIGIVLDVENILCWHPHYTESGYWNIANKNDNPSILPQCYAIAFCGGLSTNSIYSGFCINTYKIDDGYADLVDSKSKEGQFRYSFNLYDRMNLVATLNGGEGIPFAVVWVRTI